MLASLYWQSLQHLPLAVAVTAAAFALTLWLYPPQVSTLTRRWRWMMPALRAAAIAALAIALLRPVVIRPKTSAERGVVVVLVDDSRSMSVVDANRSPAQLIALASALGRLPAD